MASIFLSYRREDSLSICRQLAGKLMQRIGKTNVFIDIDSIVGGDIFPVQLAASLRQSDVVAIIIGPRWLGVTNEFGQRRLDLPGDFVRQEVEAAFAERKSVVPVLVNGATMPSAAVLPLPLQPLARLTPLVMRNEVDADRVALELHRQALQVELRAMPRIAFPLLLGSVLLLAALGLPLVLQHIFGVQMLTTTWDGTITATFALIAAFAVCFGVWRTIQQRLWLWLSLILLIPVPFGLILSHAESVTVQYVDIATEMGALCWLSIAGPRLSQRVRLWRLGGGK
jgi:TIR domain